MVFTYVRVERKFPCYLAAEAAFLLANSVNFAVSHYSPAIGTAWAQSFSVTDL